MFPDLSRPYTGVEVNISCESLDILLIYLADISAGNELLWLEDPFASNSGTISTT